jgi:hypothetical protein
LKFARTSDPVGRGMLFDEAEHGHASLPFSALLPRWRDLPHFNHMERW